MEDKNSNSNSKSLSLSLNFVGILALPTYKRIICTYCLFVLKINKICFLPPIVADGTWLSETERDNLWMETLTSISCKGFYLESYVGGTSHRQCIKEEKYGEPIFCQKHINMKLFYQNH